jgi:hypothetical protein
MMTAVRSGASGGITNGCALTIDGARLMQFEARAGLLFRF